MKEGMVMSQEQMIIRLLTGKDELKLAEWLSNPAVLTFYEGRDHPFNLDRVREKFYSRSDRFTRCIAEYKSESIAYMQFYPIDEEERALYGYGNHDVIYGMDQFIGETTFWNKGIGAELVRMMTTYLIEEKNVEKIVMDPQIRNRRALACYEKCGFQKVKRLFNHEFHEGEKRACWLIEYVPNKA